MTKVKQARGVDKRLDQDEKSLGKETGKIFSYELRELSSEELEAVSGGASRTKMAISGLHN